jgi:hypothetical protein
LISPIDRIAAADGLLGLRLEKNMASRRRDLHVGGEKK